MTNRESSPGKPSRVLVVDDEEALRRALGRTLSAAGHEVVEAIDGAQALEHLAAGRFDAVLTDIMMPELDGLSLLKGVRQHDLDVPVIVVTGSPTIERAMAAVEHGAFAFLTKPLDLGNVRDHVERAVKVGRIARAKREALEALTGMAGGAGDYAGLETTFERTMQTLWSAYQPIVDRDGKLYAHEALMRSREPELPHPGAVLDAAERLGRLVALGRHMRSLSAATMADDASGLLFLNLHPRDLLDDELVSLDAPLARIAHRVVLEITERAALEKLGDVKARADVLRERGYRIAIDDLGAGYAGLTSFALLEPDIVKLDMTLVRGIDQNATKQKLVKTMSSLCTDLGMLVVAEGVETKEELLCVLELGSHLVQGYLIARPGPAFPTIRWPL